MTPFRPDPKPITWKSAKYLKFVRNQPCIICGWKAEVHHWKEKGYGGVGMKPDDFFSLPLCRLHHTSVHHHGKETFLKNHNIDIYKELFKILSEYIKQTDLR